MHLIVLHGVSTIACVSRIPPFGSRTGFRMESRSRKTMGAPGARLPIEGDSNVALHWPHVIRFRVVPKASPR